MLSNEQIIDISHMRFDEHPEIPWEYQFASAIEAAARADEHARCVRELRERYGAHYYADWLQSNPPKGGV